MDKYQKAEQLLEEKVKKCEFNDEVYTLIHDLIYLRIDEVENEIDGLRDYSEDDDGTMWYDFIYEDMVQILCERIGKWLL